MPLIKSSTSPDSADFKANAAAMGALVAELQTKRAETAIGGSEQARARHTGRGKLLPRDRVMTLIDPGDRKSVV